MLSSLTLSNFPSPEILYASQYCICQGAGVAHLLHPSGLLRVLTRWWVCGILKVFLGPAGGTGIVVKVFLLAFTLERSGNVLFGVGH